MPDAGLAAAPRCSARPGRDRRGLDRARAEGEADVGHRARVRVESGSSVSVESGARDAEVQRVEAHVLRGPGTMRTGRRFAGSGSQAVRSARSMVFAESGEPARSGSSAPTSTKPWAE